MSEPLMLQRNKSALCVVDIQERLAATMGEREAVLHGTRQLVLAAKRLGVPVLVTEQYPKGLGPTEPAVVEALGDAYAPIEKLAFGCAGEPAFGDALAATGRRQVLLCGMEAHVCVLQTCLQLLENDCVVHVAADAVCSRAPAHKAVALDTMRQAGAVVTCVEAAVFQWLGCAGTPEFKDVLKLVK